MSKEWKKYTEIGEIINELERIEGMYEPEEKYSIPDVYAKPIQFYLALKDAYDNQNYTRKEVFTWRGLIAMLALKDYLSLPLEWEYVKVKANKNIFNKALQHVPYGGMAVSNEAKWNGKDFYVLKWKPEYGESKDLFIYSPYTLIYPIADLEKICLEIPGIKWFNYEKKRFCQGKDVFLESEEKVIDYWLDKMITCIQNQNGNKYAETLIHHLKKYQSELKFHVENDEKNCFEEISFSDIDLKNETKVSWLTKSIKLKIIFAQNEIDAKEVFSEQLLYLQMTSKIKSQPFIGCKSIERMRIDGKDNIYAFLPFGIKMRDYIKEYQLFNNIKMSWIKRGNTSFIEVTLDKVALDNKNANTLRLVKRYEVVDEGIVDIVKLQSRNIAVLCDKTPLIAIWPKRICDQWKKYYIIIEDKSKVGKLKINKVDRIEGENPYVTQLGYAPYIIPMVKEYGDKEYSVGTIIPDTSHEFAVATRNVAATVAVDFGTSSTKVFAKIQGEDGIIEICVMEDIPFVLIDNDIKELLLREYFISITQSSENVFSIYRKAREGWPCEVEAILDGTIYQPYKNENLNKTKNLISDLKWNTIAREQYFKAFINQLCYHVSVILYEKYQVNRIEWRYAVPESLEKKQLPIITDIWNDKVKNYLDKVSNIEHTVKYCLTESDAASRFFMFGGGSVNTEKGYLVADIGGGSTDIALWQGEDEKQLKWHTSIKVAGRKMFTRWLAKYMRGLKAHVNETGDIIDYITDESLEQTVRDSLTEQALGWYYKDLYNEYLRLCNEVEHFEWVHEFQSKLIQALTVFLFALGYQIGILIDTGRLVIPDGRGSFVIALAGKGAMMLEWTGYDVDSKEWKTIFMDGLRATGINMESTIDIQMNRKALKTEVARGLLATDNGENVDIMPHIGTQIQTGIIKNSAIEAILEKLVMTYENNFLKANQKLEHLKLQNDRIINRLNRLENVDIMHIFMEIIYEQYIFDKG